MNTVGFKVILGVFFLAIGLAIFFRFQSSQRKKITKSDSTQIPSYTQDKRTYVLTLSQAKLQKLKEIIETNDEAKESFGDIQAQAQAALKDRPNPIDTIQSSKILKGDTRKSASLDSVKDAQKVYALGFAYAVTADIAYAKKAQSFVLSWAVKNTASDDPIDQRLLEPMYLGYDLIRPTMSSNDQKKVDTWMIQGAHTLIAAINTSPGVTSNRNNHQSHLLAVVAMVAFSTNDKTLIDYVIDGYKKQIQVDLNPDGSSYDFHQRDALYYHVFTLEPLLTVAQIAGMNGIDLYAYQTLSGASKSASLEKSVAFLLPYATGKKTHAEWVHSTAPFDKTRAHAGDEQFQPGVLFQPKQAYPVLELYYYFHPEILPHALKLSGTDAKKYPDFLMVYLDAIR